ncbi:transposase [uncultured Ruminococcus sp.]|uniref:transposase n=1 Tax=uncultured Ruminococcus sp. TaxID=165186 RepID=UPI0025D7104C|nr:transposase [uncultured Ruminococcus sp.]
MSKRFQKPEITLDGIYSKFADEWLSKDFLLDIRFENGFVCSLCGGSECRRFRTRHLLRCKSCKTDISATNGTFIHRTRLPLRLWIFTTLLVMSNKCSVYNPESVQLNWMHNVISNFKAMIAGNTMAMKRNTQCYMPQSSAANSTVESLGIMLIYGFWRLWCSDFCCGVSWG